MNHDCGIKEGRCWQMIPWPSSLYSWSCILPTREKNERLQACIFSSINIRVISFQGFHRSAPKCKHLQRLPWPMPCHEWARCEGYGESRWHGDSLKLSLHPEWASPMIIGEQQVVLEPPWWKTTVCRPCDSWHFLGKTLISKEDIWRKHRKEFWFKRVCSFPTCAWLSTGVVWIDKK